MITKSAILCALLTPFIASHVFAQQGDRKDKQQQIDPIPADQIPPAPYLNLESALKSFKIANGYVLEPVAHGKDVDLVVAVSFDANGRAWTCEMRSYMPDLDGTGEDTPNGRIRVLEDTNGDGKIDTTTTFLDGLVLPRAVAVTSDGCLYVSNSILYFIKRNGLTAVGEPLVIDKDYAKGGNPEHKANGLLYGHDNWYYSAKSAKRYRRINGKWITQATNFRGQWGIAKDNAGHLYHNGNSIFLQGDQFRPQFFRGNSTFTPIKNMASILGSNRVYPIRITPGVNRAYKKGLLTKDGKLSSATASCGIHIYRGDNFPTSAQEMAFSCEPAAEIIKAIKISRDSSNNPKGTHPYGKQEFLASNDEWFLPCNLYTAPDGTLWMVDMYFGLLQHKAYMTTYLRKQYASRGLDKPKASTGRIYRIRYSKNKASAVPKLEGLSAQKLVPFLSHANGTIRDTAQRLIVESADTTTVPSLIKLAQDQSQALAQIHALWTLDGLGLNKPAALTAALKSNNKSVVDTALDIIANKRLTEINLAKFNNPQHTLHNLVRALAASGSADQALQLTLDNLKVRRIREAFISGLGDAATSFRKQHPSIKDKEIASLLNKAIESKKSKANQQAPGSHLNKKALESFKRGEEIYATKAACFGCHGADGGGLPNLGPPLANSEWVTGDPNRLTKLLLHGMIGPVEVNGKLYSPALPMPGIGANTSISDQDIADLTTYIRNNWGNKSKPLQANKIKATRAATKARAGNPYTPAELKASK